MKKKNFFFLYCNNDQLIIDRIYCSEELVINTTTPLNI